MTTTAARHTAILAEERRAARKPAACLATIVLVCVAALWATAHAERALFARVAVIVSPYCRG